MYINGTQIQNKFPSGGIYQWTKTHEHFKTLEWQDVGPPMKKAVYVRLQWVSIEWCLMFCWANMEIPFKDFLLLKFTNLWFQVLLSSFLLSVQRSHLSYLIITKRILDCSHIFLLKSLWIVYARELGFPQPSVSTLPFFLRGHSYNQESLSLILSQLRKICVGSSDHVPWALRTCACTMAKTHWFIFWSSS